MKPRKGHIENLLEKDGPRQIRTADLSVPY